MNALLPTATWTNAESKAQARPRRRFNIEILASVAAAAPIWLDLERSSAVSSPFHRHTWASSWQETIGREEGATPFIVVGRDHGGQAAFLWPLCRTKVGPLSIAQFVGGKHSNANFPLWRPDVAASLTKADVSTLVADLARAPGSVDMLVLRNQPKSWSNVPNPLALLPQEESPTKVCYGALSADFEALYAARVGSGTRKKLRQKERALARRGAVSYWRARSPEEIARVLEAFFVQKAERMVQRGIANAFDKPGVREFLEAAATRPDPQTGEPPIELYAASVGDQIAATFAGVVSDRRFCGMFNSHTMDEMSNESPGELLLAYVVRSACERGLDTFDLGIGEAGYKRAFCSETDTLFDTIAPLTLRGSLAAPFWRGQIQLKREIKRSRLAGQVVDAVRARFAGVGHTSSNTARSSGEPT